MTQSDMSAPGHSILHLMLHNCNCRRFLNMHQRRVKRKFSRHAQVHVLHLGFFVVVVEGNIIRFFIIFDLHPKF